MLIIMRGIDRVAAQGLYPRIGELEKQETAGAGVFSINTEGWRNGGV